MPLATRADLEALRGPVYVERLLADAIDPTADPAEQEDQKQARLDAALEAGDSLIRQFLKLDDILANADATAVCRQLAVDEALWKLQSQTQHGASEDENERAQMRRKDLAHMRDRRQWPGAAVGQQNYTAEYVTSESSFRLDKLNGLT